MNAEVIPDSLVLRPGELRLRWADGESVLGVAVLRAACRCAGCRAAALAGRPQVPEAGIRLAGAAPVGRYALQLLFSDGHDRGIYPWDLLRRLSPPGSNMAA